MCGMFVEDVGANWGRLRVKLLRGQNVRI